MSTEGFAGATSTQPSRDVLKQRAQQIKPTELLTMAQCEDALRAFKELLGLDKMDVDSHNGMGDCLRMLGQDAAAFDSYIAALAVDPRNLHALHGCAVVLKCRTRLQDSIGYLEKALEVDPTYSEARLLLATVYTDLGTCLRSIGKEERGTSCYTKAVEVDPKYAPAHYNLGVVYGEAGDAEQALRCYQAAVQHEPRGYCEAHCNIGVIQKNLGLLEEAVASYERSLAANPNFALTRGNMAVALTALGTAVKLGRSDIKAGIKLYRRALTFNAKYADAYYNLGVAYVELGKVEKAINNYELAVHFNPRNFEACNNLGVVYREMDNAEMTMKWYRAALAINPTYFQTQNNLSILYTMQGMMDEALACSRIAIADNPSFAEAYNNMGVAYRDSGEIVEAIACYDKCLELCPTGRNAAQNRLLALNYLVGLEFTLEQSAAAHCKWGDEFVKQAIAAFPGLATRQALPRSPQGTPEAVQQVAQDAARTPTQGFAEGTRQLWAASPWHVDMAPDRPLTVGYISPDYFTHSVSYFVEALLQHHQRSNFRVICYANMNGDGDAKTKRFQEMVGVDNWRRE